MKIQHVIPGNQPGSEFWTARCPECGTIQEVQVRHPIKSDDAALG